MQEIYSPYTLEEIEKLKKENKNNPSELRRLNFYEQHLKKQQKHDKEAARRAKEEGIIID